MFLLTYIATYNTGFSVYRFCLLCLAEFYSNNMLDSNLELTEDNENRSTVRAYTWI